MAKSKVKRKIVKGSEPAQVDASIPRPASFTNKYHQEFKVGYKVRLTQRAFKLHVRVQAQKEDMQLEPLFDNIRPTAKVASLSDIRGLVFLSRKLGGYWTWNVDDLEVARH